MPGLTLIALIAGNLGIDAVAVTNNDRIEFIQIKVGRGKRAGQMIAFVPSIHLAAPQ